MILEYDLQFFAAEGMGGEKTEPATEKKLSDARKEGQVAKSREIANGLGLLTVFLVLKIWVGHMGYQFINVFSVIYERIPEVVTFWHGNMPQQDTAIAFRQMLLQAIIIMAPLLLLGLVVAFLSDVVQVGWKPTGKPLQPKFSKLNPLSGFKRIFSANALVELIKSILKIGLITYICYNYLKDKWPLLFSLYDTGYCIDRRNGDRSGNPGVSGLYDHFGCGFYLPEVQIQQRHANDQAGDQGRVQAAGR